MPTRKRSQINGTLPQHCELIAVWVRGVDIAEVRQLRHYRREEAVAVGVRGAPGQEVANNVHLFREADRDRLVDQCSLSREAAAQQPVVALIPRSEGSYLR